MKFKRTDYCPSMFKISITTKPEAIEMVIQYLFYLNIYQVNITKAKCIINIWYAYTVPTGKIGHMTSNVQKDPLPQ